MSGKTPFIDIERATRQLAQSALSASVSVSEFGRILGKAFNQPKVPMPDLDYGFWLIDYINAPDFNY